MVYRCIYTDLVLRLLQARLGEEALLLHREAILLREKLSESLVKKPLTTLRN